MAKYLGWVQWGNFQLDNRPHLIFTSIRRRLARLLPISIGHFFKTQTVCEVFGIVSLTCAQGQYLCIP